MNTILLTEARGKGWAVQRNVMRRVGSRLVGHRFVTKGELREMIQDEQSVRSIVHQLMCVGRDVRSTPMHWAYESKKLDCAVKHLSWRPPWLVAAEGDQPGEGLRQSLLGCSEQHVDTLGLGRIPMAWWTQNCAYNSAYDIHRLNVMAPLSEAEAAVSSAADEHRSVRYQFIRDRPDIASYIVALRAELNMRIVMPSIVPHSDEAPFLAMARFECGKGGNPHYHGFCVGDGNPLLGRLQEEEEAVEEPLEAVGSSEAAALVKKCLDESAEAERAEDGMEERDASSPVAASESEGVLVPPPPAPAETRGRSRELRAHGTNERARRKVVLTSKLERCSEEVSSLEDKTLEFWHFFRSRVSEWNPCRTEDGERHVFFHWLSLIHI